MSELKIKVGDKEYDIPDLDFDHWMKILEREEKRSETRNMLTPEGVKDSVDFYYDLLNPYYPEVTKKVLGKMPLYQGGAMFTAKLIAELMQVPFDSVENEESQSPSENS